MSGIMGIYHLDHRVVTKTDLDRMVDALSHRGPDGSGVWSEGSAGLGHRLLWTTPESLLEKLPFVHLTDDLVITADARIDNRNELLAVLDFGDRPAATITDPDLILAAYKKWGESCPEHLLGDFAFAIWDKSTQSLFCARDHLGVKPFYYYHQPHQTFLFASEMKALVCLPEVPRHLNEVRIGDYLTLMLDDQAITTYQDIWRLPPAHSMSISQSALRLWRYWSLNPDVELRLDSNEDYAAAFRTLFTEAVRCRLRSVLPIGSHLSGGLDSSAVTCVARQIKEKTTPLHTLSTIFDEVKACDERLFINAVLAQGELIPHYVQADQFGPLTDLDQIWQYEDEAFIGPSHYFVWRMNRAAQHAGIRVLLDGFDGDTVVCHGVVKLTELAHQGQWNVFAEEAEALSKHFHVSAQRLLAQRGIPQLKELAKQRRWLAFATALQQIHRYFNISRKHLFWNYGLKPLIPKLVRQGWQWLRGQSQPEQSPTPLVNRCFAERIGLDARIRTLNHTSQPPLAVREYHWRALTQGALTFNLEQMDRYAAAFSIEARHPFLDKRLIEFCLALPSEQKLNQGWSRVVMRRALANVLPDVIQWRGGKTSMQPNFFHGMLKRDRHLLDETMDQLGRFETYIDTDVLRQAYQRMISGGKVGDWEGMMVWQAVILTSWFRRSQVMP